MKLLALVILLSTFSSLALTEVVKDFKNCPSFFAKNPNHQNAIMTPTVFRADRYKMICQRWNGDYRFATVYDTKWKIPVYSAYTFTTQVHTDRNNDWKIEPQLETIQVPKGTDVREMMDSRDVKDVSKIKYQAVDEDYNNPAYTRGHVFPNSFAADQDQADSTFTLTNIAPQTNTSNQAWAKQVEEPILKDITGNCDQNQETYIVTGAVPGDNWLHKNEKKKYVKKIYIPSHFWSTFCCTSRTNNTKRVVKAYIAQLENFHVEQLSNGDLNKRLTQLYGQRFAAFPGLRDENIQPAL